MKLVALIDNQRLPHRSDLKVERGLALHIATEQWQMLFDAGDSGAFIDNAQQLGVDIGAVDAVVLSHRHHDHCNGVGAFAAVNQHAPIYLRDCNHASYRFRAFGVERDIGTAVLDDAALKHRLRPLQQMTEILPQAFVITSIGQRHSQPKGNRYLYCCDANGQQPDEFEHESLLVVAEEDGLVVFTGCAHHGVVNMLETALANFPDKPVKAVVGGFHLVGLPLLNGIAGSKQEVRALASQLLSYPVERFYTGHCTGLKAFKLMKEVMGDKLQPLPTGSTITI